MYAYIRMDEAGKNSKPKCVFASDRSLNISRMQETKDFKDEFPPETFVATAYAHPPDTSEQLLNSSSIDNATIQPNDTCLSSSSINKTTIQPNDCSQFGYVYAAIDKQEIIEPKIVARPSPEDDDVPTVLSPTTIIAKVPMHSDNMPKSSNDSVSNRGQIDTKAPFDSVKSAVSKFGGIVEWRAHRVQTKERQKSIEQELEKALQEVPLYKKQAEAGEDAKIQVLEELDSTKRLIEELELNLELASTEEQAAQQDSQLAKQRVEELERRIAQEASFAAKAQLEVSRARNSAAASELKSVKDELEQLEGNYALLVAERDAALDKAEETIYASKQIENSVGYSTIELITAKKSLESAYAMHLQEEEHRIQAVTEKEISALNLENELKWAEEELERLNEQFLLAKDVKLKLDAASTLLEELQTELTAYTERRNCGDDNPHIVKKELGQVKLSIERATAEFNCLNEESTVLKSELENEKSQLAALRQREGMASTTVASLEAEMNQTKSEIGHNRVKEGEETLPEQLQEAAQEVDGARELAQMAHQVLQRTKEEAEEAKARANTVKSRLAGALKEIEAVKASEKLARVAINALQEDEEENGSPTDDITLSLEEYYQLRKQAHEAEEQAKLRMAAAISQIEVTKESELRMLNKLEEVNREMDKRKDALQTALQKSETAEREKLGVEEELRKRREVRPKESPETKSIVIKSDASKFNTSSNSERVAKVTKKKKKSLLPRIFTFLGRKKSLASKKSK